MSSIHTVGAMPFNEVEGSILNLEKIRRQSLANYLIHKQKTNAGIDVNMEYKTDLKMIETFIEDLVILWSQHTGNDNVTIEFPIVGGKLDRNKVCFTRNKPLFFGQVGGISNGNSPSTQ